MFKETIQDIIASIDNQIILLEKCKEEICSNIENSGLTTSFLSKFVSYLTIINETKHNCTYHKNIEILKQTPNYNIYSMQLKMEQNLRILFTFDKRNNKIVILTSCFQEKDNKKKNSKNSYTKNIAIAEKRLDELYGD